MPARLMTARQRAVHAWIACYHGLKAAPADCWPPRSRGKEGPRQPDCTARNICLAGQGRAGQGLGQNGMATCRVGMAACMRACCWLQLTGHLQQCTLGCPAVPGCHTLHAPAARPGWHPGRILVAACVLLPTHLLRTGARHLQQGAPLDIVSRAGATGPQLCNPARCLQQGRGTCRQDMHRRPLAASGPAGSVACSLRTVPSTCSE